MGGEIDGHQNDERFLEGRMMSHDGDPVSFFVLVKT
jgi:hypothetical protein